MILPQTILNVSVAATINIAPTALRPDDNDLPPNPHKAKCGWTSWLNSHAPSTGGEIESMTTVKEFCPIEDITAVECQPVGNPLVDQHILVRMDGLLASCGCLSCLQFEFPPLLAR